MASAIIGRRPCLLGCGFEAAHVKRSDKCVYLYCPGCGLNVHTRGADQQRLLLAGMRPEMQHAPTPTPTAPAPKAKAPAPTPTPTPAPTAATAPAPVDHLPPAPPPTPTPAPVVARKRSTLFGL